MEIKTMKVSLVIIDPQNSFCKPANPQLADHMDQLNKDWSPKFYSEAEIASVRNGGELFVPGADEDCVRLTNMINRLEDKIDAIHVTLDSHQEVDVAHPVFWIDENGDHPDPFTIISVDDVVSGKWLPSSGTLEDEARATFYVGYLNKGGRYPLCIWPPHCIIGSEGHQIDNNVSEAIRQWAKNQFKSIDFVQKGSNPWTEHYSAIKADVPDESDPSTGVNTAFLERLGDADKILVSGQALNFCVANTILDMIDNGIDPNKIIILVDTSSNVPGFEQKGKDFVDKVKALGVRFEKSSEIEIGLVEA
jgi:nicotinamidase-related amidase